MFPADTKFLLVDDLAAMRKLIKKVLSELGYTNIQESDDGKSAFELLLVAQTEGKPFQFIISDWNMPGMSGINLLRACKNNVDLRLTPFILVTAESDQKNIVEAARAGVSDYVVKPFSANTLKEKLRRVYGRHSAAKAAA